MNKKEKSTFWSKIFDLCFDCLLVIGLAGLLPVPIYLAGKCFCLTGLIKVALTYEQCFCLSAGTVLVGIFIKWIVNLFTKKNKKFYVKKLFKKVFNPI